MPEKVAASLRTMGLAAEQAVAKRLEAERQSGQLSSDTNPGDLAAFPLS